MDNPAQTYLAVARKLIDEKRYDDARTILETVDHPTAKKWLDQLDKIAPDLTPLRGSKNALYEYKVLSQKDKWSTGKFDPETIEEVINDYAEEGWRVLQFVTTTIPGFGGAREEMIIILERPKSR